MQMRSLEELVEVDDPALPMLQTWLANSSNRVELIPANRSTGERTLLALQVTARSMLGALALHAAALLVDGGWLRILGAGGDRMSRDLASWNYLGADQHRLPGGMLVADDVLGGFFAVNGGAFDGPTGNVWYLAPDSLAWEDCRVCTSELDGFYESMRWPGWQDEVAQLDTDQGISVYPFLFAAGDPIAKRSRRPVSIEELWALHAIDLPRQLAEK